MPKIVNIDYRLWRNLSSQVKPKSDRIIVARQTDPQGTALPMILGRLAWVFNQHEKQVVVVANPEMHDHMTRQIAGYVPEFRIITPHVWRRGRISMLNRFWLVYLDQLPSPGTSVHYTIKRLISSGAPFVFAFQPGLTMAGMTFFRNLVNLSEQSDLSIVHEPTIEELMA